MNQKLHKSRLRRALLMFAASLAAASAQAQQPSGKTPDYASDIAPILRTYCVACHDADGKEGGLALDSYKGMLAGGERGAIITAKRADLSRLVRVLTGESKPQMPPEDNEAPTAEQIALLRAWIDAGAKGPEGGEPDPKVLVSPRIEPTGEVRRPVSAIAVSPDGDVATARYAVVELTSLHDDKRRLVLEGHRGNVNAVTFSADGKRLAAAAGEAGLFGEVRLWNVADGKLVKVFEGHQDSAYAAALSPDSKLLASGGYDQQIILWDIASGEQISTLTGHNGAVFALAFRPDGEVLASASGDRTVKLWRVADGERLDTLGQSLQELYAVAFSPRGERVAAAGVDNRIRIWQVSQSAKEGSNPLLHSVFAHDSPILRLAYSPDGQTIVSAAQDRLVKSWNTASMTLNEKLPAQSDWPTALAVSPDNTQVLVGRLDGQTARYELRAAESRLEAFAQPLPELPPEVDYGKQPPADKLPRVAEIEPNDAPAQATPIAAPGIAAGAIHAVQDAPDDADLFRFTAQQGGQWIIEIKAARDKSPLDSKIEVLFEDGRPVQRALLRAVRDSELEFRGMDSNQRGARLKNWEEMLLNEYIYIGGEVVKHYQQRRGPDSDAQFYPEGGNRYTYFDTTAHAHALGEPAYIVVPYPPETKLPDNGLPAFPVYFENDDDSRRELGSDSRLAFTAPADGVYLVRVSDVRGFGGEDFKYALTVRRPQPDFKVTVAGANPTVNVGSGKEFTVRAERIDNFDGPIRIDITGLPPGFTATTPIVIESGHREAKGVVSAHPQAPASTEENWSKSQVTASANIAGKTITHESGSLETIKLGDQPKLAVQMFPTGGEPRAFAEPAEGESELTFPDVPEIVIEPGQTITCQLRVERNGFDGRIQFDVDNLPHGVIVDNIGLNGVLIPEGKTERTLFLIAEPWVPQTSRMFHAVAKAEGNQSSLPMTLHVRPPGQLAAGNSGQ